MLVEMGLPACPSPRLSWQATQVWRSLGKNVVAALLGSGCALPPVLLSRICQGKREKEGLEGGRYEWEADLKHRTYPVKLDRS